MELVKKSGIAGLADNYYFWRTHIGQEIDIIKESDGKLIAMECKWSESSAAAPSAWLAAYPESSFKTIHRKNYMDFVL